MNKSLYYRPCFLPKNGSEITQNFYYIFRYTLMSLCYVEILSRFRLKIFELWLFKKISQFLKISLYYSPCFFPKNGSEITQNFYYIFRYTLMSYCYVEILNRFCLYSTGSLVKFCQKLLGENSPFLVHFLIHIQVHTCTLCR